MYISFDPGPDLGWAQFLSDGSFFSGGIIRGLENQPAALEGMWLPQSAPFIVISEIWRMYNKNAAFTNDAKETIMSEGMVRYYAHRIDAQYVEQGSDILSIGQKWTGLKIKKGAAHKDSHDISARVHGEYYLMKNRIKEITL